MSDNFFEGDLEDFIFGNKEEESSDFLEDLLDDYQNSDISKSLDLDIDIINDPELNIIQFMESPLGLGLKPTPFQKFILKLFYGIPLSDTLPDEDENTPLNKTERLVFRNPISGFPEGPYTEVEFLDKLREDKKCNGINGKSYKRLLLVIGRRGGKSFLSTIVSAYEIYKLLRKDCPQEFYSLKRSAIIKIIVVGTDKSQSERLFTDISQFASYSPYLRRYLLSDLKSSIQFVTPYDLRTLKKGSRLKPTLTIQPVACRSSAIRGDSVIQGIMDEVAFMKSSASSKSSSAEEVYKALQPAISTFDDGKLVLISSPNGTGDWFHSVFDISMRDPDNSDFLCIQAPTWEVNPGRVSDENFASAYRLSKNTFHQEYGARFETSVSSFIENFSHFSKNVYPIISNEYKEYGSLPPRDLDKVGDIQKRYYVSIDQAFKHDSTVVSIGFYDSENDKIIVNNLFRYTPGDLEFTLMETGFLSADKIVKDFAKKLTTFNVVKGIFDQHEGATFQEKLINFNLTNFYSINLTDSLNSEIYKTFRDLYNEERLEIPGLPWLMTEFKNLESRQVGKHIKVEGGNSHQDDGPDSIARLVYLIYKEEVKKELLAGDNLLSTSDKNKARNISRSVNGNGFGRSGRGNLERLRSRYNTVHYNKYRTRR